MKKNTTTMLVILDGMGHSSNKKHNAVYHAKTPNLDSWIAKYPNTLIDASGEAVGLPTGYMGNSEVGHFTIGTGKTVEQPITQINKSIDDKSFFENNELNKLLQKAEQNKKNLHILGLLSDAGVHSHIDHLFAILETAKKYSIKKIYIHAFLDGRDTPPKSAKKYLRDLENKVKNTNASIASIHGRFYAMDRDNNWDRTKQSYDILVNKQNVDISWKQILEKEYTKNINDEFIQPIQIDKDGTIKNGDCVLFFNFRADRARQLTNAFINKNFDSFDRKKHPSTIFLPMMPYTDNIKNYLFKRNYTDSTFLDIISSAGKTIFTIAETEKYAHVTYFFNGGREISRENETKILVPSIKTKSYVDNPEMSAKTITRHVLNSLKSAPANFYLINYANPDMVGHSGDFDATVKAIECLDKELGKLYEQVVTKMDGTLYITADHGNAEIMFDEKTNQPHTQHTCNPVRFLMIRNNFAHKKINLSLNGLSDIAPFVLKNME